MDIDNVYYAFKDRYKNKLLQQFNSNNDKLYYIDIYENSYIYNQFIRKINYLLVDVGLVSQVEYLQINNLLTSNELIDRLNGLKKCKDYIKIK